MPRRSLFFLISFSALLALGFTTARANRHHHSFNISSGHRRPATDCSDLRIRFDDQDAVVRSEQRTLTKAEAVVLQVHPHSNGGVQVVGWDKETYSVTACKAAAASGDAERTLSQITMSIEGGRVSKKGPLTLMVPSGYQSSFVVESTNYAPVSCKASICDNARKTWDDEHRRIEYGNAPAMIRLSTVNGPVSVRESREKL